ncbi:MAG TPA: UvrD-helicase domain-containing protein, partial [Mycobacteriales bacterium]|nr:UvrD-helicase domain-containing protein [Mycobacteriales bacterium]
MSAPVDQPARDKVRTDLSSTLFVEAGAGTGKTTALVDRVVHAVATGHLGSMARLAAITFTENAAAELRTRIREALELGAVRGKDREHNYDAAQRALLRSALEQIDDAAITTLHGFAARILQDVPIEAGLPPGFAVNDAIRAQLEATARWRTFLDELLDDESVAPQVLAALTLELRTDKLREVADAFAGSWDALQHRPFMERPLPAVDLAPVLVPLRRAASCASAAPDGDRMTEHLRDVVVPAIDELMSLTDDMDRIEALQRLQLRPGSGNKSAFAAAGLDKDEIKADLEEAVEARKGILTAVGTAAAETLCARLQDYTLAEVDRRRREGSLTFHDLLVLTRDVLRSDASVRRRLHERYPVVLIDEFQDTDPLQVEIACLIAGSLEQAPGRWDEIDIVRGGLFFVGDPKQSIYRFRRADVQLYQ